MTARKKTFWMLLFVGLAVGALILLVAGLPWLEFRPGQKVSTVSKGEGEVPLLGGRAALIDLTPVLMVVFWAILVAFGVAIVYLLVSREARKKLLMRFLPLLLLLAALLVSRQQSQSVLQIRPERTAPVESVEMPAPGTPVVEFDATPPRWLLWGTSAGIALAVILGVGGLVWLLWPRESHPPIPLQELAQQAQTAIQGLESGAGLKDTILRCYFEMSRTVSQARGVDRWVAMTPREFESRLVWAGMPRSAVQRLTRLFEQVRYGAKTAGPAEEQEALDCLASIVQACQEIEHQNQPSLDQPARLTAGD
jgi:Domain of unknown function (DUF4129)